MKAALILEDGSVFEGESFGFVGEKGGEAVFNTSLTGYQEILTDPSYKGQILVMTYPEIGNYGVNEEDIESTSCHLEGFIVKEYCDAYSNHRARSSLSVFLKQKGVIGISGIETRSLALKIREKGAMKAYIACGEFSREYLSSKVREVPSMVGLNLADKVSTEKIYEWEKGSSDKKQKRVVVVDCGVKHNILRNLSAKAQVIVVPSKSTVKEILSLKPDGVLLSNGPGDPSVVRGAIDAVTELLGKVPIFGICLGHQILSIALGGKTYKLKFGHRGANHPVKNLKTGLVEITSQNHGFAVDSDSFASRGNSGVRVTHMNLNDGTVEGIECEDLRAFSVQYHPEASPGPHDSVYLFEKFMRMMGT